MGLSGKAVKGGREQATSDFRGPNASWPQLPKGRWFRREQCLLSGSTTPGLRVNHGTFALKHVDCGSHAAIVSF